MINKTILDNGVRVITEEISHVHSVSIGAWIRCGARHESNGTNGMSHFIEHMLFKGTKTRSAFDIASAIDSVGGIMNAFTGKEYTSFYIKIPDYHLGLAIDLLADIFLNSVFDKEEFSREKAVILQEILLLEDSPDEHIHDLFETMFWNGNSLGLPILGKKEQVEGFKRKDVIEFFKGHYCGDNLVITAAGNLKHDILVDYANRHFGSLQRSYEHYNKKDMSVPLVSAKIESFEKELEQVHLVIGTVAPSVVSDKRHAGVLINAILGGSMSSRLFQEIREKRGLAYAIHSYIVPYIDTGMLGIYAGMMEDKLQQVIGLILDELNRLSVEGLTEKELSSTKELIKGNFLLSMESTDNRMSRLAKNELCFGRHVPYEEIIARINAVEVKDILELSKELFNPAIISIAATGKVSNKDLTLGILRG